MILEHNQNKIIQDKNLEGSKNLSTRIKRDMVVDLGKGRII